MEIMCGFEKPCVRFCSLDAEKYSDKILFDEFMESKMNHWYEEIELNDANIFRGLPLCNGKVKPLEIVEDVNDESDEYSDQLRIYGDGDLYINRTKYIINTFCLERDESSSQKFIPMVCTQEGLTKEQATALVIMSVSSIIVLVLTLSVYLYFTELRDFSGKIIIFFLTSMICTNIIIPGFYDQEKYFYQLINLLVAFGFSSGNLWLNSMILSIYFRIRDFRNSKFVDGKFASYRTYVGVFTAFVVLFSVWNLYIFRERNIIQFISLLHTYFIFNDFVILIIVSIKMRNTSKQIGFSERVPFEKEKKIFWIYVKLFAIMSVTWSTQIFALNMELNYFACLIATLMMLFSAVNVSGLFVGRKKVRELLLKKG